MIIELAKSNLGAYLFLVLVKTPLCSRRMHFYLGLEMFGDSKRFSICMYGMNEEIGLGLDIRDRHIHSNVVYGGHGKPFSFLFLSI